MRRYCFPEHDLTVHVVRGKHTSEEVIQAFQSLDSTCATRWLNYLDPTADMSKIDIAHVPAIRRAKCEKRRELFGDDPKPFAIVCGSKAAEQYFFDFWKGYAGGDERCFRDLDEAYDWLGLSEAARAAVTRAIDREEATPTAGRGAARARAEREDPRRASATADFPRERSVDLPEFANGSDVGDLGRKLGVTARTFRPSS